ncbi:hypothetical protein SAMN05421855_1141 [Ulvibacter litoralis]|uniref:Uncharacterized protein n=1 Tax=Ulvibacter litoralis TaxID=227084 RepID=A0A1G7JGX2_9FLAO|nr:hypothetical protein SAMN05421855_1141 [Ulvibacter litoralis]
MIIDTLLLQVARHEPNDLSRNYTLGSEVFRISIKIRRVEGVQF